MENHKRKAVFFDIDGTLWDEQMQIPKSTSLAIQKLRENGHYAFICSGRSRAAIRARELFAIGFDGVLAGCGTHVEYRNRVVYERLLGETEIQELLDILHRNQMPVILEGPECLYAEMEAFGEDRYVAYLKSILGGDLKDITERNAKSRINKMSAVCSPGQAKAVTEAVGERYGLIFHKSPVVEILPRGFSKASGIRRICACLGIAREDTYAFGDSTNDLDMLKYVHTGIAMGNGTCDAKEAADHVTAPVGGDGIWKGLAHFGLIRETDNK